MWWVYWGSTWTLLDERFGLKGFKFASFSVLFTDKHGDTLADFTLRHHGFTKILWGLRKEKHVTKQARCSWLRVQDL